METIFDITQHYVTKYYYTKILLWLAAITALYFCYKKKSLDSIYSLLKFYLSIELFLGLIDNIISPNPNISTEFKSYFINFSNSSIALIELFFFGELYNKIFPTKQSLLITRTFYLTLFGFFCMITISVFFFSTKYLLTLTYVLGSIEFLFIFYLAISYFVRQINNSPEYNLFTRGSFWCFTGALFYCAISAPFYIVGPSFPTGNATFDLALPALLYYLPYSIHFVCIIISLKCKTQIWN